MNMYGPYFSDSRDPMVIFSDSRGPIFNSRDPNRVPKTPRKKLLTINKHCGEETRVIFSIH